MVDVDGHRTGTTKLSDALTLQGSFVDAQNQTSAGIADVDTHMDVYSHSTPLEQTEVLGFYLHPVLMVFLMQPMILSLKLDWDPIG